MGKSWKIAIVVQRYGLEVNGGAELHARWLAQELTQLGKVQVFTTCAIDYYTWKNHYPDGSTEIEGVSVTRFPVDKPRDWEKAKQQTFDLIQSDHTEEDEIEWMKEQGPLSSPLLEAVAAAESEFDVFIFFTYLYATTFFGLPLAARKSLLVPTAHDEPYLRLEIFRETFNLPKAVAFNTESERQLVNDIVGAHKPAQAVIGVGVNVPESSSADRFRKMYGISNDFLLYVGRVDESKNVPQLMEYYARWLKDYENPPALVLLGKSSISLPENPNIISLGFVEEEVKFDALAAASIVIIPSLFESLSMIALEAWSMNVPLLVNGHCEVLKQQCRLSNGGLYYYNFQEFTSGLNRLLNSTSLRKSLGYQGRTFTEKNYQWEIIRAKYQALFSDLF